MQEHPTVSSDYEDFQMPLAAAMTTQRAIRRVKPDPVDDALVLRLIELALKGPTAQNEQGWEFIVVKDPEGVKRKLGRQNRSMWRLYRPIARFKTRNDPKAQRMNDAVEWGVDHFEEIPVFVVACFRGSRLGFPPVVAASTYGSILPAVQESAARRARRRSRSKHQYDAPVEQLGCPAHPWDSLWG